MQKLKITEKEKEVKETTAIETGKSVFPWIIAAISFIVVVVNIILTQIDKSLSSQTPQTSIAIPIFVWVIVGLVFVIFAFIIIWVITNTYSHYHIHHNYPRGCISAIDKINSEANQHTKFVAHVKAVLDDALKLESDYRKAIQDQLIDNEHLAEIEKSVVSGNGEIYILTSKFKLELQEPMRGSLIENINQGVNYRYIIPISQKGEFNNMVYEITRDDRFDKAKKNRTTNDYLVAVAIPDEQILVTIAFYPLNNGDSEVIIKLPSDTQSAKDMKAYCAYKVPKTVKDTDGVFREHHSFLANLKRLFEGVDLNKHICPSIDRIEKAARPQK